MRHVIAFIVIGLVLGILGGSSALGGKAKSPIGAIIGGLVGGIAGGEVFLALVHGSAGKYGSLVVSIVIAAILAWLGRGIGSRS